MNGGTDKVANVAHGQLPADGNGEPVSHVKQPVNHGSQAETVPDLLAKFALTDVEVGRLLGVPAATVLNLHRTGSLKAVKIGGRCCWRPADVEAFVEALEGGA